MAFTRGELRLNPDFSLEFTKQEPPSPAEMTGEQQAFVSAVGKTVKAYRISATELLAGRYKHLSSLAPSHLAKPGIARAFCGPDAVVIRYERGDGQMRHYAGWTDDPVAKVIFLLSEKVIRCHPFQDYSADREASGIRVHLTREPAECRREEVLASAVVCYDTTLVRPTKSNGSRPFRQFSLHNTLETRLEFELIPDGPGDPSGRRFLVRKELVLPVGWDCIEVFPYTEQRYWNPEVAEIWAENDILGAVVSAQYRESQLNELDPCARPRREYEELLTSFKALLESNPDREEVLQVFLNENPKLLCPAHMRVFPKLALGSHKTDFVFEQADGEYLLVELERSTHLLFQKSGKPAATLNHACDQVRDWKRYIEDNLQTVQRELRLTSISANPPALIVIGRSASLSGENRRTLAAIEAERPRVKILTYDDVYHIARAVVENYFGPLSLVTGNTQVYCLGR